MKLIEAELNYNYKNRLYESNGICMCHKGLEERFNLPLVEEIWVSLHDKPNRYCIEVSLLNHSRINNHGLFYFQISSWERFTVYVIMTLEEKALIDNYLGQDYWDYTMVPPKPCYVQVQYLVDDRGRPLHPVADF